MASITATKNWRTAKTLDGLRRRYPAIYPLLFQRTIERANSAGEAFDILEGIPATFPLMWDDQGRQWITPTDMWLDPGRGGVE